LVLVLALFFIIFANEKDPAITLLGRIPIFLVADGRFLLIKKKHCCLGSEIKIRIVIYSSPALFNSASGLGSCPLKRLYKDIGCSVPPLDRILSLNLVATSLLKIPFLGRIQSASRTSAHL
jgi:hypothetical protein